MLVFHFHYVFAGFNDYSYIYDTEDLFLSDFFDDYDDFYIYDTIEPIYETSKSKISEAVNTGNELIPFKKKENPQTTVKPSTRMNKIPKEPEKPKSKPSSKKETKKESKEEESSKTEPKRKKKRDSSSYTKYISFENILILFGVFILTSIICTGIFFYFYNGYRQAEDQTRMVDHMRSITRPQIEPDNDDEKIRKTVRYG